MKKHVLRSLLVIMAFLLITLATENANTVGNNKAKVENTQNLDAVFDNQEMVIISDATTVPDIYGESSNWNNDATIKISVIQVNYDAKNEKSNEAVWNNTETDLENESTLTNDVTDDMMNNAGQKIIKWTDVYLKNVTDLTIDEANYEIDDTGTTIAISRLAIINVTTDDMMNDTGQYNSKNWTANYSNDVTNIAKVNNHVFGLTTSTTEIGV